MSTIFRAADRPAGWIWPVASARPQLAVIAALHTAAFVVLCLTDHASFHAVLFALTWGFLNFIWLLLLRRPAFASALSLLMLCSLILLSHFKAGITWVTLSFFDLLVLDRDTVMFLPAVFPQLRVILPLSAIVATAALVMVWRTDPFRVRRQVSGLGAAACLAAMCGVSLAVPEQPWEPFEGTNHVSNFIRSGVTGIVELASHGWLEADAPGAGSSSSSPLVVDACQRPAKRPHIITVLDESSFDITAAPGVKVPADYRRDFRSFDGKERSLIVEATGGPTWYAEYSVLTGLSARSFGRFKYYVTRIAAGHVLRSLPLALHRCGYSTFSLYPETGAFMGARNFQTTAGIDHFVDASQMGGRHIEPDAFYFDQVVRTIAQEKANGPLFIFSYVTANHFPWSPRYWPELTPGWKDLGNDPEIDEYIRRQMMSAHDYAGFLARLKREFPDDSFLVVRYGDHQPWLSTDVLEPELGETAIARKVMAFDPRYFTTYYAVDAVNFQPVDMSSALDRLDAPYLPLLILEAAGLPRDATFIEQKRILQRCGGVFYQCGDGAEARRFNRMLIDAGLIKGF
jgi:hypothetical protein